MAEEYFEHRDIIPKAGVEKGLIWSEIFATRREWNLGGIGTDYIVRRHPGYHTLGDYGLELTTKTTTPAADDNVFAQYSFPLAQSPVIHLTALFTLADVTAGQNVDIELWVPSLAVNAERQIKARISVADRKVYILKDDNTFVEVGTLAALGAYQWNYLELTFDRNTDYYKTLKINEQSFTVSSYRAYTPTTPAYYTYRVVGAKLTTLTAAQKTMYVGHFIIRTQPY